MSEKIVKFCTDYLKLLFLAGAGPLFLLALILGYYVCTENAIFNSIDVEKADEYKAYYWRQLICSGNLMLLSLSVVIGAFLQDKRLIALITAATCLGGIAIVALFLTNPSSEFLAKDFEGTINQTRSQYEFKPDNSTSNSATRMWDDLQSRGCCGWKNYTDWKAFPKSCCSKPMKLNETYIQCQEPDSGHNVPCQTIFLEPHKMTDMLLILSCFIVLYLHIAALISTRRMYSYDEASQNAYS